MSNLTKQRMDQLIAIHVYNRDPKVQVEQRIGAMCLRDAILKEQKDGEI
jgi:hypothetical protein